MWCSISCFCVFISFIIVFTYAGISRKSRLLDVVYNASNNELVRTKTLVKSAIIQIDSTPFKQWWAYLLKSYQTSIGFLPITVIFHSEWNFVVPKCMSHRKIISKIQAGHQTYSFTHEFQCFCLKCWQNDEYYLVLNTTSPCHELVNVTM